MTLSAESGTGKTQLQGPATNMLSANDSLFDGQFQHGVGRRRRGLGARQDNRRDGDEDDDHAGEFGGGEALVQGDDADEYCDDRVDERVGGDLGDGDVLQQVDVCRKADHRSEGGEIKYGEDSARGPLGGLEVACGNGDGEVNEAGGAKLPGGGGEGVDLEVESAGEN